jgi:hypothetical protein
VCELGLAGDSLDRGLAHEPFIVCLGDLGERGFIGEFLNAGPAARGWTSVVCAVDLLVRQRDGWTVESSQSRRPFR